MNKKSFCKKRKVDDLEKADQTIIIYVVCIIHIYQLYRRNNYHFIEHTHSYLISVREQDMPQHGCDLRPLCESVLFLPLYWVLGSEFMSLGLCSKHLYLLNHFIGLFFVFIINYIQYVCVCSEDNLLGVGLLPSTSWRRGSIPVFLFF